ncbi:hemerythrin domain-containing protein [Methanomassiliicoccus luminyensis]|uniref:hemerythrin domain-containing protein n=1 Tax=Methanomassiliicoccus luminyensis TaxID=1080712 RepID=UPI00037E3EA2|nr:hemerythrin domain-containing protein [Methanomassiliicoccus luminyensis]
MIEHRLIERMISVLDRERERIEAFSIVDTVLAGQAIDFMSSYADRCHHGKEENILFRKLEGKGLSSEDQGTMAKLTEDHRRSREMVAELREAVAEYSGGDPPAALKASDVLRRIVSLYAAHIKLEDEVFFPRAMKYLSKEESALMLKEFEEFDRRMVHEHYTEVVEAAEKSFPNKGVGQ